MLWICVLCYNHGWSFKCHVTAFGACTARNRSQNRLILPTSWHCSIMIAQSFAAFFFDLRSCYVGSRNVMLWCKCLFFLSLLTSPWNPIRTSRGPSCYYSASPFYVWSPGTIEAVRLIRQCKFKPGLHHHCARLELVFYVTIHSACKQVFLQDRTRQEVLAIVPLTKHKQSSPPMRPDDLCFKFRSKKVSAHELPRSLYQ